MADSSTDRAREINDPIDDVRQQLRRKAPPALLRLFRRVRGAQRTRAQGDFASFAEAARQCNGWEAPSHIATVLDEQKRALGSRPRLPQDSGTWIEDVALAQSQTTTPSSSQWLAAFFRAMAGLQNPRQVRVLDFGGALGTHYFTARPLLAADTRLDWTVWETPSLAATGRRQATPGPHFAASFHEARASCPKPDIVLAIGSLMYACSPLEIFEQLASLNAPYLLLSSLTLYDEPRDRLTVEVVPAGRHADSLPVWFLARAAWLTRLSAEHRIVMRYMVPDHTSLLDDQLIPAESLLLERRDISLRTEISGPA